MRKLKDSKLGFEVGSGLKKSQSKYSYEGICKLYGEKVTFYDKVLKRAEDYSQRFLEGTRRGKAMMNLLKFKRSEHTITTAQESGKGNGWKPASIQIIDHNEGRPVCKRIMELAEKIKECEFDIRAFYYKGKLDFIFLTEVYDRKGIIEKVYHDPGNKIRTIKETQ